MSLGRLLEHRVTVKRQVKDATGMGKSYADNATNVPCLIQPFDPDPVEQVGSSFTKDFKVWFTLGVDVKEGDKLLDQDGRSFGVRGVRARDYGPVALRHIEALVALDRSAT